MADTKTEILEATETALLEHGYHDLTTQKVAEGFGGSHSLVHYHFETKEDLLIAFLDRYREQVSAFLTDIEDEPPGARLVTLLEALGSSANRPRARRLYLGVLELQAYAGRHEAYRETLEAYNETLFAFTVATIEDGITSGAFADCDPAPTARLLLVSVRGALVEECTVGIDVVEQVVSDALLEHVLADLYVDEPPEIDVPTPDEPATAIEYEPGEDE
ncbi:MAG: TetR/AcrR family transcriptional regulator [Halobacteriales archaeon]